jgi:omega-6 fatty acid desaturase (delta-12 desaturase)
MIRSIQPGYTYASTLILALPAAAYLVRLFIWFHDCMHGSFFASKRAGKFFGYPLGVLVFTYKET